MKFLIRRKADDDFKISEVFAGEETHLTFVDSFKAALMFIALRRSTSMPRSYSFTIEFLGDG
jgi:hypothetical protein